VRRAIGLLTDLQSLFPSVPGNRHLLACCYRDMALGVTDPAKDEAITILLQLAAEFPGVPEYLYDLAETYAAFDVRGGTLPPELVPGAERQLAKALEDSQRLNAAYPHVPDYVTSLVHIRHKLGAVLRRLNRPDEAEGHLRKAVDLQAGLARQFAGSAHRMWLVISRHSLAEVLTDRGDLAEARSVLEAAIADLQAVRREESEQGALDRLLGDSYARLARVFGQMGDRDREAEAWRQAESYGPPFPGGRP
jgi:tetratricopeptide (TPR) repeat protein